jgi:FkbM family methyltransferase
VGRYVEKFVPKEASPNVFAFLDGTLWLNLHIANTQRINQAAAAERGTLPSYSWPGHNVGLTTTVRSPRSQEFHKIATVKALSFDEFLTDYDVRTARLFKIDVEGGEVLCSQAWNRSYANVATM